MTFATAEEVGICYFGLPTAIVTDQATHFYSEFAKIFKIHNYSMNAISIPAAEYSEYITHSRSIRRNMHR